MAVKPIRIHATHLGALVKDRAEARERAVLNRPSTSTQPACSDDEAARLAELTKYVGRSERNANLIDDLAAANAQIAFDDRTCGAAIRYGGGKPTRILLSRTGPVPRVAEALAHEVVHAKQFLANQLARLDMTLAGYVRERLLSELGAYWEEALTARDLLHGAKNEDEHQSHLRCEALQTYFSTEYGIEGRAPTEDELAIDRQRSRDNVDCEETCARWATAFLREIRSSYVRSAVEEWFALAPQSPRAHRRP